LPDLTEKGFRYWGKIDGNRVFPAKIAENRFRYLPPSPDLCQISGKSVPLFFYPILRLRRARDMAVAVRRFSFRRMFRKILMIILKQKFPIDESIKIR